MWYNNRKVKLQAGTFFMLGFLLSGIIWIQCASEKSVMKPSEVTETPLNTEVDIDVLSYIDEDLSIAPPVWEVNAMSLDTALPAGLFHIEVDTMIREEDKMVVGHRVHISTSDNFETASAALEQARLEFPGLGVYMEYDPPNYKIRVGDCQNRVDAETLLRSVKQMGYPEAFLVRSRIYLYPELRKTFSSDSSGIQPDSTTTQIPSSP